MIPGLREHLEGLCAQVDASTRIARDPVRFARAYDDPADAEIAAFLAASLAYGRVSAFGPVIERILDVAREHGGPAAWIRGFDAHAHGALQPIVYRFNRGDDLVQLAGALRRVLDRQGTLGALVTLEPGESNVGAGLSRLVQGIRRAVLELPDAPPSWEHASAGLRYLLPDPADGSAAKRLCMLARWMVRTPDDGVDLGLWTHIPPSALVIPLDTHVHRIARLIGLTARKDASWRTALDVTASLARLDPADPVRFDFALAHQGISGGCTGALQPDVCGPCALRPVCATGRVL